MARAKNTINPAEVSTTPIKIKYSVSYTSSSLSSYGISLLSGSAVSYSASMTPAQMQEMNHYRLLKQLYYQNYLTGSLLGSASFFDPWWQSTAASSSGNETIYQFPTGSNESVLFFVIPPQQFGEQVSRTSFVLSASDATYHIIDDGNGNLIDTLSNNYPVGNIFYSQGIAVISNQDYIVENNYLITDPESNIYNTENSFDIIIE